jgi:hypothetical protein
MAVDLSGRKRDAKGRLLPKGGKRKKGAKKASTKRKGGAKKASAKGMSHGGAFKLLKPAKGASDKARLKLLEQNQAKLGHGIAVVAAEVMTHRRALMGAGLLSARGRALPKGG